MNTQRQQQADLEATIMQPVVDDCQDPLAAVAIDANPFWQAAWKRAGHSRLPRPSRVFAWRLLHAGLRCGGSTVAFYPPGAPELCQALCQAPCCLHASPRPLETLQHLFLQCPVGKSACRWLCALWEQVHPQSGAPPFVAQVLLADDLSGWHPPQQLIALWTLLRVTMLKRIWLARCAAVAPSPATGGFTVAAILAAFVWEIRSLIQQDWARVQGDVRQLSGVCPGWFRGRDPQLPLARFKAAWCTNNVLAAVEEEPDASPRLSIGLSTSTALVNAMVLG